MNNISISLEHADGLFSSYQQSYPLKSIPPKFKFESSDSITTNLNNLALYALHPASTLAVLYSYPQIALDVMARWVHNTKDFEAKYQESQASTPLSVQGSTVVVSLTRVLGLCSEATSLIEHFVENSDIVASLDRQLAKDQISAVELQNILLAYYRLISHDRHRFKQFVSPRTIYKVLKMVGPQYNIAKYIGVHILAEYLDASEASLTKMVKTHVANNDLHGEYENETIDYRYLQLIESKRMSSYTHLPSNKIESTAKGKVLVVSPEHLSPLVISICGVLVPKLVSGVSSHDIGDYVPTEQSVSALQQLAYYIQNDQAIMLYGKAGSGKTYLINQVAKLMSYDTNIIKIHLGEQTDSKMLLGTYTSGEKPGTFVWKSGVLTSAVKEGKWILIEDIDKAPTDVLSILLTLLEKRELTIPSRGEVIKAKNGFQIISTIRTNDTTSLPDMIGMRLWKLVKVELPSETELRQIIVNKYPLLASLIVPFIKCFNEICKIYASAAFLSLNKGSNPRVISFRDLMKFCCRCNVMLKHHNITSTDQLLESSLYDNIFAEAIDCFGSSITEYGALVPLVNAIGETLEIPTSRINLFLTNHVPLFVNDDDEIKIGRAILKKAHDPTERLAQSNGHTSFAKTNHSLRLMEQIGVSIQMTEPILLVGETGTGKTTVVQQVSKLMNKKLTVINVSQQTEAGDLLGGYKPVNANTLVVPVQDEFTRLFRGTFSQKKNEKFDQLLAKCLRKNQWKNVVRLWREAVKLAYGLVQKKDDDPPTKKRKLTGADKTVLAKQWAEFEAMVDQFEVSVANIDNSFVFNFVEGSLVKAVRNGDWLLLDEINLASSDTLESIVDLLGEPGQRTLLLTEKGDIEPIVAHPDFRIFGCMNPSTDIGKKDLPPSIRSRFSEIYVHSPDKDIGDLLMIIDKYIHRYAIGDEWVGNDIAQLYLEAKKLSETNQIVDGANQKPHFSIRTLTRTLVYVCDIVSIYGLRRSLYEGFCMAFLTLLDVKSESILKPIIAQHTLGRLKNAKSVISQCPPAPNSADTTYVQFKHYWMKKGPHDIVPQPHYIITPFVEKNMLNLVRASAGRRFPVLVQGPTSAGKTSMIKYLANITGHKFVRINNHEHTDLQEYLGTYVSDSSGKLTFKEGVLVEALRKGHWIVLDELNLAPTDVLEALNRLLDDNRELFIPETQEVVHPHPDFMLFATQNPPGLYGGRKVLSRAFRNRFLELHFDDIPQDELEIILKERCQIAPSYGSKIVEVYRELSIQRQSSRLFEQKNSFATLRDLFRWAMREAVGYDQLAANGYMLLAERVRKYDEKKVVQQVIEKVMRVKLNMDEYYETLEAELLAKLQANSRVVWTKSMRRLAVLVYTSMKYHEPLLLVGETGCGKTTVCQVIAEYLGRELVTVNAHQNTETGDILGAQRPVRNKDAMRSELVRLLRVALQKEDEENDVDFLWEQYKKLESVDPELAAKIDEASKRLAVLFEWNDGPLIQAMKQGDIFLLDEISLADDSVLERLNSVLEPERSLLLAEKGSDDAFIVASPNFEFLATMNPGGDYGKKELSPALRNRFTEVWVPSMNDFNDVAEIVASKLANQSLVEPIVKFSQWYGMHFGGGRADSGIISLRDILAWVQFVNSCPSDLDAPACLLHGASMVFIDALGTNNTAYLAENEARLAEHKLECVAQLSKITGKDLLPHYHTAVDVKVDDKFYAGPFTLPIVNHTKGEPFNLSAPTTAANAMRVVRAMQVHKPILLEGSPGVGKTSLVTALAQATGNPLVRINLSEHTDLVDLFGSDAPAGTTGEFVWRDAPFLRAMQRGEWVLLDEMNLASQSVLEGLNACLDHRGQAYIPELDRTFSCHKDFRVFAAQNPQYQGGGRKGLPKSFVNRFSVVYVDVLKSVDLNMISSHLFPKVDRDTTAQLIEFISQLETEVVVGKKWGSSGGPWEFNLRDTLRWLSMYATPGLHQMSVHDFFDMIIAQRFRTADDRAKATQLFEFIFGKQPHRDNYYSLNERYVQIGDSLMARNDTVSYRASSANLVPLHTNLGLLETAFRCVNHNLPLIVTGPTNSGKTELIRFMANLVGCQLDEFAMNSDVDSMDILGGYEQVDHTRTIVKIVNQVHKTVNELSVINLRVEGGSDEVMAHAIDLLHYVYTTTIDLSNYGDFHHRLVEFCTQYSNGVLDQLAQESKALKSKIEAQNSVKFAWFDGLLVQAVENGNWLVLDNANLCSPSVLDRLNSLLETNGTLIINECSGPDGQPRVIKPHPNFRLFLTVDPKYGELSRAMRNRGVEIYCEALPERASDFDTALIELPAKPMLTFLPATDSRARPFALLEDIFNCSDATSLAQTSSIAMSILPFNKINDVKSWLQTVLDSTEFSEHSKLAASDLNAKIEFASNKGILSNLANMYKDFDSVADAIVGGSTGFSAAQSPHPLLNSYIDLAKVHPMACSAQANYFFEVMARIIKANNFVKDIEDKALNGKVSDLNYIQKSAAYHLGRNLKNPPRLEIFKFLKQTSEFVETIFDKYTDNIFSCGQAYTSLYDFQLIWESMLETSAEQNESKLRVYQQLISKWVDTHPELDHTSMTKLKSVIDSFVDKLTLTSGYSMDKIWERFRNDYPKDSANWASLEKLVKLAKEFDEVASEQFGDSKESLLTLKKSIIDIYNDITASKVTPEEFEHLYTQLSQGINTLKQVSSQFITKRQNDFASQVYMVSNFVESHGIFTSKSVGDSILNLSCVANIPTDALLTSEELFRPYPSIFTKLWADTTGPDSSKVSGLFYHDLLLSSLTKVQKLPASSGKYLQQKLDDMSYLKEELVNNSTAILTSQVDAFQSLLVKWILEILHVHIESFDEQDQAALVALTLLPVPESLKEIIETIDTVVRRSSDDFFKNTFTEFFIPALLLLVFPSMSPLGKAWVLFSCGSIQLYVPSSSYDPAIKEYVIYKKFNDQQLESEKLIQQWKVTRKVLIGDHPSKIEELIPTLDSADQPNRPRVFRNPGSIDRLFEEWKSFMESSIDVEPIQTLLEHAESLTDSSVKMNEMFQQNSNQFLLRLRKKFGVYSDLNDILVGYVYGLKFGFDLLMLESQNQVVKHKFDPLWSVNVVELSNMKAVTSSFENAKNLAKTLSTDSVLPEYIMTFFMRLSFAHSGSQQSRELLQDSLQSLYYRWSLRRMKEDEENAQSGNLYKYNDVDGDSEEDFKKMFPDYEDVIESFDGTSSKKNQSFEEIYYSIAKVYMNEFYHHKDLNLQALVTEGAGLLEIMSNGDTIAQSVSNHNNASVLASLILRISSSYQNFTVSKDEFDFYRGTSTAESKKASTIVANIHTQVIQLLNQWPEHATLQNIATASDEYLSLAAQVPISRLLQKIEQIYTLIAEWEKYASSQVTLKASFDELTGLIVSWRKLELSTWKSLFAHEELTLQKNIGKWWFHLFEVIVMPLLGSDDSEEMDQVTVLAALNLFMSQSTYGEYSSRLNLLKSFRNHALQIVGEGGVYDSLANFIQFYEQFMPLINDTIEKTKVKLEKDINEVILLASWKDVNIDALKQSARRSHNNLYKIVRKYRALLATPASGLIQNGLSAEYKVSATVKELPAVTGQVIDKEDIQLCSGNIASWKSRPARLQDLSLIEKNMNVYVARVAADNIPNLYEYSKSILEEMGRLRNETPKELKKDNKKIIAALKTQKRKLLADTLRELRKMGLKLTLRADIMEYQGTVNTVMSNTANFSSNLLENSDAHFFRVLDLLPRLRAAVSEVADDVPPADAQKGLAVAENLVHSLIATRDPLNQFANELKSLGSLFESFETLSSARNSKTQVVQASVFGSSLASIETIAKIINWLPKIIDYVVEVIQVSQITDSKPLSVLLKAKFELSEFSFALEKLDRKVSTNVNASFIQKFHAFYTKLGEDMARFSVVESKDSFAADIISEWIKNSLHMIQLQSSTSLTKLSTVEDSEAAFRDLTSAIIVTVQKVTEIVKDQIIEDDDDWLKLSQQRVIKLIRALHLGRINEKLARCIELVSQIEHNQATSDTLSALARFTIPLLSHYYKLSVEVMGKARKNYTQTSHATFILATSLHNLATKGFCSPEPPSEQKEDNNLQDGTGLGDGEGADNNSKDVGDDEDLSEDAQQPNEEKKDKDEGDEDENDDAVDIEGDMAGDLEEASDQDDDDEGKDDEEEEELDEEVDDIDDLDPNAIDEKMWDEEAKDDKEKDSDKMPENSKNDDDNMQANEDEDNQNKDKNPQEDGNNENEPEEDKQDGEDGDDEQDVGEQEDEVKNDENEKLEDHVPETETLDLPEDMKLDGDEEGEDEEEDDDEKFDDKMDDIEEKKEDDGKEEDGQEEDAEQDAEEGEDGAEQEGEEDENMEDEGEHQDQEETEGPGEANEDPMESEDETLGEKAQDEQEEGGNDNDDMEQETAEGADTANDNANDDDVDMESAVKQESGEQGEGADNQVIEENDDIGATGGASSDSKQQEDQDDKPNQDEARDMAKESLKQLGDSLKEFHRRRQEIQQASEEKEEKTEQSANERPDEFEHVDGENADFDTQALGAADKDQIQPIDEDMAIDDDADEEPEKTEIKEETDLQEDDMEVEEKAEEVDGEDANVDPENDFEGKTKGAFIGERKKVSHEDDLMYSKELNMDDSDEEVVPMDTLNINDLDGEPPIDLETARELWRHSELSTQELASGLCEQLRLILEPTLATKLKGDYKTGKRLNMKRIITYIASEFRKDKIWLRRTKPSKRQYQIMIAVDDSKSMSESKSTELAYHSIALVSKALTQLESGGLSIVRFGEDIKVVHPFDKPFNNQETGSKIFQWFDFQQTRTDIKQLCSKSLKIFEDVRGSTSSDLWQLQIILSDGVCEDHESIQRMVRKAREQKVMLVFVIIDGINSSESILDMSQVSYVADPNTGAMNLKVDKYLDTFPFEFYVVVRNINELPEMLSLILRQYFSEMASA